MDTTQHYSGLVFPQPPPDSVPPQSYPQNMSWQVPHQSLQPTQGQGHAPLSSMMPHSQDHVEYAAPSAQHSFLSRHAQDFPHPHPPSPSIDTGSSSNSMSFDSPQIQGSIGPDRGLSRRRHRPPSRVQSQGELPEYAVLSETQDLTQNAHYPSYQDSRPPTPSGSGVPEQFVQRPEPTVPYTSPTGLLGAVERRYIPQPQYRMNYQLPQVAGRSASGSTSSSTTSTTSNPRSASPALSTASALTSASSAPSGPSGPITLDVILPLASVVERAPGKKKRLFNTDRRDICMYAREHPGIKQENIALYFGVERSTVSKILKQKHRWLAVADDEAVHIAKMRPSKFPDLEYQLSEWVKVVSKNGTQLSDALLRKRAREIGDELGYTADKFKASSGWLENFKHRHGIRRGVWTGSGYNDVKARAYAEDFTPPVLEDCPPGPFGRTSTPSDDGPSQNDYGMTAGDDDDRAGSSHNRPAAMHPSSSLDLQPSWPRAEEQPSMNISSGSSLMYSSGDQSYSIQQDSSRENELPAVETALPPPEPVAISIGGEDGGEGGQVYVVPVMPEVFEAEEAPSAAEAEKALDKVLRYVRTNHGELEMNDSGFQLLVELKYKLFGKVTGQPFDPRYMPKHGQA